MKRHKILFVINGLGLGNSTRCEAIVRLLVSEGNQVSIVSSGNGLDYFRQIQCEIQELYEILPLQYGKCRNELSMMKTIFSFPFLIRSLLKNILTIRKIVLEISPSTVVFDSDYAVIGLRWLSPRPVLISVNNAALVVREFWRASKRPWSVWPQYLVEVADAVFNHFVADVVLSPWFLSTTLKHSKYQVVPPIVRLGFKPKKFKEKPENILVMLSGSQFGTGADKTNDLFWPGIKVQVIGASAKKVYDNRALINQADIMVINAGFSAVSEVLLLNKFCVVVPIPNHAEQLVNALVLARLGRAIISSEDKLRGAVDDVLIKYRDLFEESFKPRKEYLSGAIQAGQVIIKYLDQQSESAV